MAGRKGAPRKRAPGGLRILIVEDQVLIAELLETVVREAGHVPVGPVSTAKAALQHVTPTDIDAALLDVRLSDGLVFSVCEKLAELGKPFAFVTGSAATEIPARFRDRPTLAKPYGANELLAILLRLTRLARSR